MSREELAGRFNKLTAEVRELKAEVYASTQAIITLCEDADTDSAGEKTKQHLRSIKNRAHYLKGFAE